MMQYKEVPTFVVTHGRWSGLSFRPDNILPQIQIASDSGINCFLVSTYSQQFAKYVLKLDTFSYIAPKFVSGEGFDLDFAEGCLGLRLSPDH